MKITKRPLSRLENIDRCRSKWAVYNVYKFSNCISEEPPRFYILIVHKAQKIIAGLFGNIAMQCKAFTIKLSHIQLTVSYLLISGKHKEESTVLQTWGTSMKICCIEQCTNFMTRRNIKKKKIRKIRKIKWGFLDHIQHCHEYEGKLILDTEIEVTTNHVW
jgi:hypothetical protein